MGDNYSLYASCALLYVLHVHHAVVTLICRYMLLGLNMKANDGGFQANFLFACSTKQSTPRDRKIFVRELLHSLRRCDRFRGVSVA